MFETYFLPILIFVGIGLLAGILLAIVSVALAVKENEKTAKVREALPSINCGACGYSSCDDYAKNVAENGAPTNKCVPGGETVAKAVSEIMGVDATSENDDRMVAFVRCNGNCDATSIKYDYEAGVKSCAAVKKIYSGNGACDYGCTGYGDCTKACDFDAISVVNGVAVVDPYKCVGCSKCVNECPSHLIKLVKASKKVHVQCSSKASGKATRTACQNGCIACGKCQRTCKFDAIAVEDNRAVIDYTKCTDCGECVEACPMHCITQK